MQRFLFALILLVVPSLASAQIVNWGDHSDSDQTIYLYFNTVGSNGVAETLADTPDVEIFEDGSDTEIDGGGETLTASFNSVAGLNQVSVDLSQAAFEAGKTYTVVLDAGTVDSVSVAGRIVGVFSIDRYISSTDLEDAIAADGDATRALVETVDGVVDGIATIVDSLENLLDDPRGEPGQGAPGEEVDLVTKIDYLYKAWRNKVTTTATSYSLYADDGTTVDQKSTNSDNDTTFTKGEIATGP